MSARVVDGKDVWVIQCAGGLCFDLEAFNPIRSARKFGRQDLNGHRTRECRVGRSIDLAHASLAYERLDLISAKTCTGLNDHDCWMCTVVRIGGGLQIGGILDNFGSTCQSVITTAKCLTPYRHGSVSAQFMIR